MNWTDRKKIIKRALARHGMFSSFWLINKLSYPAVKWITHAFIAAGFLFTKRLQRIARETLTIAFKGEKTEQEIDKILKDCFTNLGRGIIEMIYYFGHPEKIRENVSIQGKENLDQALAHGRGAVVITAHFGNFPLMMTKFAQEGYETNVLMRKTRDPKIDTFLFERRSKMGVKTIYTLPRRACVHSSLRALRNNELLFMLVDQNFGSDGGVFVDFFGRKAATATGPVVLAGRAKSPIIPVFIRRLHDDQHQISIQPPLVLQEREDPGEMIYVNIAHMTKVIEEYIRRYPHEWGWMHRRWKSNESKKEKQEHNESAVSQPS